MLKNLSNVAGGLGVLLCIAAVLLRLVGVYHMSGFETMTLFNVGIAGMVLGCFLKLELLLSK